MSPVDVGEEGAAEAFATAVERWPADGVPPNPGWLIFTCCHPLRHVRLSCLGSETGSGAVVIPAQGRMLTSTPES